MNSVSMSDKNFRMPYDLIFVNVLMRRGGGGLTRPLCSAPPVILALLQACTIRNLTTTLVQAVGVIAKYPATPM